MKRNLPLILISILLILAYANTKTIKETFTLTKLKKEGGFHYMTKMAMDIGSGSWTVKAKFNKRVNLPDGSQQDTPLFSNLYIFLDDEWNALDHNDSCSDKIAEQRTHKSKKMIEIPANGDWSRSKSGTVAQSRQRRVWFFVFADCEMQRIQKLIDANRYAGIKIEVELILKNNKSHFASDESGFILPISFLLIVTIGIFTYGIMHMVKQSKKGEDFDYALFLIVLALGFQLLFLFFQLIHQLAYSSNGKGLFGFDLLGQILEVLSSFILSVFLLLVSWGWTINYMDLDSFDVILPLAVLLGVVHVMIMGLGKLTDGSHYKYHQYDGWPGYLIMAIRIGLFVYFQFGLKDILKNASIKLKQFIQQMQVFGSLYFLAFPILLVISWFIAPYVRNVVITIGTLLIQTISFVVLIWLNTSQKSGYYKVSMKSKSVLPGVGGF